MKKMHIKYNALTRGKKARVCLLTVLSIVLLGMGLYMFSRQSSTNDALDAYRDFSGANDVYAVVKCSDASASSDLFMQGMDTFAVEVKRLDSDHLIKRIIVRDPGKEIFNVEDSVYAHIPLFLNEADYSRMELLMADPQYIAKALDEEEDDIQNPVKEDDGAVSEWEEMPDTQSGMTIRQAGSDPLNFFQATVEKFRRHENTSKLVTKNDYVLTSDDKGGVVTVLISPEAQDDQHMARVSELLDRAASSAERKVKGVHITVTGNPLLDIDKNNSAKRREALKEVQPYQVNTNEGEKSLFVVSSAGNWDKVLESNEKLVPLLDSLRAEGKISAGGELASLLVSKKGQGERITRWNSFMDQHRFQLVRSLAAVGSRKGLSSSAFDKFEGMLDKSYSAKSLENLAWIGQSSVDGTLIKDRASKGKSVMQILTVPGEDAEGVKEAIESCEGFNGEVVDVSDIDQTSENILIACILIALAIIMGVVAVIILRPHPIQYVE